MDVAGGWPLQRRARPAPWGIALVALSFTMPVGDADWLQDGGDAARTGVADRGPSMDDVVFDATLDGGRVWRAAPIIVGDAVYLLSAENPTFENVRTNGVFRVDLESGDVTVAHAFDRAPHGWASDGRRIVVAFLDSVEAFPLGGGASEWAVAHPPLLPGDTLTRCRSPALHEGVMYAFCVQWLNGQSEIASEAFVHAIDVEAGSSLWMWHLDAGDETVRARAPIAVPDLPVSAGARPEGSVSVAAGLVLVTTTEVVSQDGAVKGFLWAIDSSTGDLVWTRNSTSASDPRATEDRVDQPLLDLTSFTTPPWTTGRDDLLFMKFENVLALNPARGTTVWEEEVRRADAQSADINAGMALRGPDLFVTTAQSVYRFDAAAGGAPRWGYTLPPTSDERWASHVLFVAPEAVVARGVRGDFFADGVEAYITVAFDPETGRILWRHEEAVPPEQGGRSNPITTAMGSGVLAMWHYDGRLIVLGRTAASPTARVEGGFDAYPAPGEAVEVDLGRSRAGAHGPITRYRAEWGDGNATEWQESPVLTHAYADAGDHVARLVAGNDAGQTSSAFVTVHVGGGKPGFAQLLANVFAPGRQDATFFVLGLLITAAGSAVGLLALRRRRGVLRRELGALDVLLAAAPEQRAVALSGLRSRHREMLVRGDLTEAQFFVLDRRAEEIGRG